MEDVDPQNLRWQSKLILLLVAPAAAIAVVLQARVAMQSSPQAAIWTVGLSGLLGVLALAARSGTPAAAATGAVITANLMFAATQVTNPLRTALLPVLTLLVLTSL